MVTGVVSLPQESRVAPGTPLRLPARELMKLIQEIKKSFAETGAAHGHEGTLHPAADMMWAGEGRGGPGLSLWAKFRLCYLPPVTLGHFRLSFLVCKNQDGCLNHKFHEGNECGCQRGVWCVMWL